MKNDRSVHNLETRIKKKRQTKGENELFYNNKAELRRKVNVSVNNEQWSAQSAWGSLVWCQTCPSFIHDLWSLVANSCLGPMGVCRARQRCIRSSPPTCQSLISSQDCNIRDASQWLPRLEPVQLPLSRLEADRLGSLMQILVCLIDKYPY